MQKRHGFARHTSSVWQGPDHPETLVFRQLSQARTQSAPLLAMMVVATSAQSEGAGSPELRPTSIGIDLGITLLSAENLRTGKVWGWFMKNPEIVNALDRAGVVAGS